MYKIWTLYKQKKLDCFPLISGYFGINDCEFVLMSLSIYFISAVLYGLAVSDDFFVVDKIVYL